MLIRAATVAGMVTITAIYRHDVLHGTGTFETVPPDTSEMTERHARIVGAGYPFLVADDDGVVGYGYAGPFRERQAFRFLVEDAVYVAPAARKRGIGGALVARLVQDCAALDFRQMVAVIGDSANLASIAVHARCGFATVGRMPSVGWKADRWLDIILMQRELGNARPD